MKECPTCHKFLLPLARFCGHCGQKTGFDLPALQLSAAKNIGQKIESSRKRKGLAGLGFILVVFTVVICVMATIISLLADEDFAAFLFLIAGICLLVYFKEVSLTLHFLVKVSPQGRCLRCGSILHKHEVFCEQCGQSLK